MHVFEINNLCRYYYQYDYKLHLFEEAVIIHKL